MMRLWADVYNAAGARQGDGPIRLRDASVTRNLDGIGSISFSVPGTDPRAIELLTNERRVRLYAYAGGTIRELGRGIIRNKKISGTAANWTITCSGPDDLDALTRRTTLLGRKYSASSVATIAADLADLADWNVIASGGNITDARFDGTNVWKALTGIAEAQGLHVRGGLTADTVEIGAFGDVTGLRLINVVSVPAALHDNDDVALIESIDVEQASEAVATRLYPMGAGIGEALLTLELSTRTATTGPYAIQTVTGPDGATNYYLEDSAASAEYGVIEKFGKFRQVAPLSNSPGDVANAADALYDIAAAWLERYSQRQDVYRVTVRKLRQTVRPGDKVRLTYKGLIIRDGEVVNYLDVDADMWVSQVVERAGVEGQPVDLTLVTVDRQVTDSAQTVIGAMEDIQLDGVTVKQYFNGDSWVYNRYIKPSYDAVMPIDITTKVQRLVTATLRIKSGPFRSTVAPTLTITDHRHSVFNSAPSYQGPYTYRNFTIYDDIREGNINILLPVSGYDPGDGQVLQTAVPTIADFAATQYDIYEDSQTPTGIQIWINGTNYTASLGGPWAVSPGAVDFTVDISAAILAAATLQQRHTLTIKCTGGRGEIEAAVELYTVISSIRAN